LHASPLHRRSFINTPHVCELVTSSGERGIQSFDVSLRDLFKTGRITLEEALASADSRANLEAKINFG
jgi:twitching motility protein PilU